MREISTLSRPNEHIAHDLTIIIEVLVLFDCDHVVQEIGRRGGILNVVFEHEKVAALSRDSLRQPTSLLIKRGYHRYGLVHSCWNMLHFCDCAVLLPRENGHWRSLVGQGGYTILLMVSVVMITRRNTLVISAGRVYLTTVHRKSLNLFHTPAAPSNTINAVVF